MKQLHTRPPSITTSVLLLAGLCLNCPSSAAQPAFAAPFSGKKVTAYRVELPTGRKKLASFEIPSQCSQALAALRSGANQWGTQVQRHLWFKVAGDCQYQQFITRYQEPPAHDFVTGYDFRNARFQDLPLWSDCAHAPHGWPCRPVPAGFAAMADMMGVAPPHMTPTEGSECRIENGLFKGYLLLGINGIRCLPDRSAPGFRLKSVDYADVNNDGYMDAVLRLAPLGRGVAPLPVLLPLTRMSAQGPFTVPSGAVLPGVG